MNAILSFDLNEAEDRDKFEIHIKAEKTYFAVEQFSEFLNRRWKHEDITPEQYKMHNEITEKFADIFFGDE
jgi:hypothetical protein